MAEIHGYHYFQSFSRNKYNWNGFGGLDMSQPLQPSTFSVGKLSSYVALRRVLEDIIVLISRIHSQLL